MATTTATRIAPRARRVPAAAAAVLVSSAAVGYVEYAREEAHAALAAQGLCLVAAAAWLVLASAHALRVWQPSRPSAFGIARVAAVLALAFAVRAYFATLVPLPGRTMFEELQMGSDGHRLLATGVLPLEFRFSKALSALGLWWGGDTVDALRVPFRALGYASLAVTVACLRSLGVGWWPVAATTLAAAGSRWFVISGCAAYEDFSGVFLLLALVLCLVRADTAGPAAAAWAAWAGAFAGVLLFENSSFRFAPVLAAAWLGWLAAARSGAEPRVRRWRPVALFAIVAGLVSAPMLVDIAHSGSRSVFFEAVTRYANGRATLVSPVLASSLVQSFRVLAGLRVRISFYLSPENGQAVHPVLGALFVAGAVAGLFRPKRPAVRALTLAALLAVVVASAATNFFMSSRLAAVAPILLLCAGAFLDQGASLARRAARRAAGAIWPGSRRCLRAAGVAGPALMVALAAGVVVGNVRRVGEMVEDVDVLREYRNDQYQVAAYLARAVRDGSRVVVVTPGLRRDWSSAGIAEWVYARRRLDVRGSADLPTAVDLRPGEAVVLSAEGRALRTEEVRRLQALARAAGADGTLRLELGRTGRVVVGSFVAGRRGAAA